MSRGLAEGWIKMASKPPPPTHFLCIPLVTPRSRPQLTQNMVAFREDVTRPKSLGGFDLPLEAIRPVGTVHLTLGMMSFPQNEEGKERLEKALHVLRSLHLREIFAGVEKPAMPGASNTAAEEDKRKEGEKRQILITLKGLHCLQKPEKATVLYTPPVDPLGTLQEFSERVRAAFKHEGLFMADNRPLLLHATIVNMIYVRGRTKPRKGNRSEKKVIGDSQAIVDRYEDQVWMEDVPLERIAICKMGAKPVLMGNEVVDIAYEEEGAIDY